ncbi:hypothetical protein Ddye_027152 [Dipteronia dyeriana]|uniref:DRBM domain-containing protein n=1 Tax=Dipteronia dyeriana TaxID=168575 RepID=A0AAD9TP07_9ROSI|nr:hypothetical protein Ddye_027152 [Dipteronia dyeriana]
MFYQKRRVNDDVDEMWVGIQILWQIFWQKKVPRLKGITSSGVPNRFCSPVVVWGDVHCRLEKIDSPSYTSTGEGPAHAPCFKVRVTVDEHAFESLDFFKSRKAAEHVAINVALMSVPFDGFQEASSLTESCHMPASVQGGLLSSPPMTHADCSLPSISDSSVGRLTGTQSYLLYNTIRVYPCVPDISFPKGYYFAAN